MLRKQANIRSFSVLKPIIPIPEESITIEPQYRLYSTATIPTSHGMKTFAVFHGKLGNREDVAIAYYPPSTFDKGYDDIVVRVHDACATSELFDSVKCDCKEQLEIAKQYIAKHDGIIIYLNQEGRGIGLGNKIAAYHLQQTQGLDTVAANRALGLPDDTRRYEAVRDILSALGVQSIKLLSNNPRKKNCLTTLGVKVNETIPCLTEPKSEAMRQYMATKAERMEHQIPASVTSTNLGVFSKASISHSKKEAPVARRLFTMHQFVSKL